MEIVEVLPHLHMLLPEFGQAYLWCDAGVLTLIDTGMVGSAAAIAIYLPRDRALFTGDAVANPGRTMLGVFNTDRARAIEALHRLAALDTQVACFGHGDPITTNAAKALREAAEQTG